jgi:UDP-3-O-[3-hydroxymyristoyl] glucosamine N-acyltransferase
VTVVAEHLHSLWVRRSHGAVGSLTTVSVGGRRPAGGGQRTVKSPERRAIGSRVAVGSNSWVGRGLSDTWAA